MYLARLIRQRKKDKEQNNEKIEEGSPWDDVVLLPEVQIVWFWNIEFFISIMQEQNH